MRVNLSTVAYAVVNRSDWGLASCFAINAICCAAILAIVYWKRRSHTRRGLACAGPSALNAVT
jgi:hypothetical protein